MEPIKLIVSIVERGRGAALQKQYAARRVSLHFQCAGRGTATSEIMDILGLGSTEKDVVLSFASAPCARRLLHDLDNDLRGRTGTSGIVFSLPLTGLNNMTAALIDFQAAEFLKGNGGEPPMEQTGENTLVLVTCNRGHADSVMATAKAKGARGGTVVKGRLAGLEDLEQAYGLELTAEREIVAIVLPVRQRGDVMEAVNAAHGLRSPAQALCCSLPIEAIVRLG